MFLLNNKPLQIDVQFETTDGTQYPSLWLRMASQEERDAIGIVEIPNPEPVDQRFYYPDGSEKNLDDLKAEFSAQANQTAYNCLVGSDWMVIRASEGTPVPQQWTDYRAAVRMTANLMKDEIQSVTSFGALIDAVNAVIWPQSPLA